MTATDHPNTALRAPFPRESIGRLPKGGTQLDYVGHAAVTDRLLSVDPEWTWEPFALTPEGLPAVDKAGNLWIKLTVNGVTRPGVGDGRNAKELIGDAIRNAAMRFGVALDLWTKDELESGHLPTTEREPVRLATVKPATTEQADEIAALAATIGLDPDKEAAAAKWASHERTGDLYALTEAEAGRVIEFLHSKAGAK